MSYTHYLTVNSTPSSTNTKDTYDVVEPRPITQPSMEGLVYLADYSYIQFAMKHLMGKVLTVIDASVADPTQRKAIKDIIRSDWAEAYGQLYEVMFNTDGTYEVDDNTPLEEVSLEEALGA